MPHALRLLSMLTLPLLASLLAVAHAEDPSAPTQPNLPTAPTCAKQLSKQIMSGGALKTVMVDNAACLEQWEAYDKEYTEYQGAQERWAKWVQAAAAKQAEYARAARAAEVQAAQERALAAIAAKEAQRREQNWESPTLGTMQWIPEGRVWMMEHEVTQGEWKSVMGSNPSSNNQCGQTCPVENVKWKSAVSFAKKASARDGVTYTLPTEAEWELAAHSEHYDTSWPWDYATTIGWIAYNSGGTTHAVCGLRRTGYGLCDMLGNVWEWTSDWDGGPGAGSDRVVRGGDWGSRAVGFDRAGRGGSRRTPTGPYTYQTGIDAPLGIGFRLVRTAL